MNNLTLCLYSVSNGHWSKKDCYLRTIKDLDNYNIDFYDKVAHIKIRPGEEGFANVMEKDFIGYGYRVIKTISPWRRWDSSHHIGQLQDIFTVFNDIKSKHILHMECDWLLRPLNNNLQYYLQESINLLESDKGVLQVRIPRQIDEFPHFKTMEQVDKNWKKQNEIFSLNPHVIQHDVLRIFLKWAAENQVQITQMFESGQLNVELLFAHFARTLVPGKPLWSHSSENIRALHIGNKDFDDTLEKVY